MKKEINERKAQFNTTLEACAVLKEMGDMAQIRVSDTFISDANAFANYINSLPRDSKNNLLDPKLKKGIKGFQDVLGKQATQKLALKCGEDEQPEFKITFKMANNGVLKKKLCSIQDVEQKRFIWITEAIEPKADATFEEELAKLMKKHNVEGEFIKK